MRALAAVVAAVFTLIPVTARADDGGTAAPPSSADGPALLAQARAALEAVDYPGAQSLCVKALSAGGLSPRQTAAAYRLAGVIAASIGNADAAREAFSHFLALDPEAALGADVSPKITEPFAAARAKLEGRHLAFRVAAGRSNGQIEVELDGTDPLEMVATVRVRDDGGQDHRGHGRTITFPATSSSALRLAVSATDAAGNILWTGTAEIAAVAPPAPTHRVPTWARWPTWTVVAVAAGGASAYFGWRAHRDQRDLEQLNANSAMHSFDEAQALADRGRRDALITNVGLGITGAAVAAAIVTAVLDRPGVEVRPAVSARGAVSLSVALRFR